MAIITQRDLKKIRGRARGKKIVFASGSFDLVHAGHVLFLEDCKKHGDILVVGVGSDKAIKGHKEPYRPILNEHVRIKLIDSLKPVDYTLLTHPPKKGLPVIYPLGAIFQSLKPDLYVVNGDIKDIQGRKAFAAQYRVRTMVLKRKAPKNFKKVSTTQIIARLKNL